MDYLQERIDEIDLNQAVSYIFGKSTDEQRDLLGVLYAPIVEGVWTDEAKKFCNNIELTSDEVIRLAFWFIKEQLDNSDIIEGNNPYKILALQPR
jgi:hypothetical protein